MGFAAGCSVQLELSYGCPEKFGKWERREQILEVALLHKSLKASSVFFQKSDKHELY